MGRGKQITVLAFIAILLFGCVYLGIQVKNKPKPAVDETPYEGSYKETSIPLPVINKDGGEQFLQLLRGLDDSVELYTILYNEDKSMVKGYKKYVLNSELKWDESESDWMELQYFSDTTRQIRMLSYADTGSVYVLVHDLAATDPVCDDIVRIGTDGSVERINVRGLYKTDKDENPIQIETFFIKDNMICFTDKLSDSYAYSLANGTLFAKGKNAAAGGIASDGKYLYLLGEGCTGVVPYRIENGKTDDTIPFRNRILTSDTLEGKYEISDFTLLSDGEFLYLSCQDGIYRYNFAGGSWKQLMGGLDCIFGRPSIASKNFIATAGALYMFSRDLSGNYYFTMYNQRTEEEDEKLKRTDFTILSYERSAVITETAAAFQHDNPSLRVLYRAAHEEDGTLTVEAYRSLVQKELTDKKAIDVLVCDELDYKSYMDSGLFENISDLMKPLYTAAELFGNVTNTMAQTKIFVTPAKFDIFLMYGKDGLPKNNDSFEAISSLAQKISSPVLGTMEAEEIAELLSSFYEDAFLVDGSIDKEALTKILTLLPSTVKLASKDKEAGDDKDTKEEEKETETEDSSGWFGMPNGSFQSGITLIRSKEDFLSFLLALKDSGADFSDVAGHFIPRGIVGINSKSSNIKTAKEFVRALYSDSVQQANVGLGIPMQQTAVEAFSLDGVLEDNLSLLLQCLTNADTVYKENKGLKEALLATLTPYLNSEITAEEAAEKIMDYTPSTALK
ncbi:MAG: hypothetical protein HFG79_02800 [Lachnospiraceae bacterium]|nr:hypothetical protein [Lachnospiraceae bacterium]